VVKPITKPLPVDATALGSPNDPFRCVLQQDGVLASQPDSPTLVDWTVDAVKVDNVRGLYNVYASGSNSQYAVKVYAVEQVDVRTIPTQRTASCELRGLQTDQWWGIDVSMFQPSSVYEVWFYRQDAGQDTLLYVFRTLGGHRAP